MANIGDIRVSFAGTPCSDVTFLAQQVENEKGEKTIRKWNPEMKNVPYGGNNDPDMSSALGCSPCCKMANMLINMGFEETIFVV